MEKPSFSTVLGSGDELEGLRMRHQELEQRLQALERHLALTSDEQTERARLKKEKLWVKDRITVLRARPGTA